MVYPAQQTDLHARRVIRSGRDTAELAPRHVTPDPLPSKGRHFVMRAAREAWFWLAVTLGVVGLCLYSLVRGGDEDSHKFDGRG